MQNTLYTISTLILLLKKQFNLVLHCLSIYPDIDGLNVQAASSHVLGFLFSYLLHIYGKR